jgi:cellulose synthase/poly-beta-1,6-N-acetylglucosamine synthase-like glycosyltransferase
MEHGIPRTAAAPVVSVIIPALNEEKTIGRCLEALCRMQSAAEEFEVILVDNGSRDRTIEVAGEFNHRLNLRILQRPGVYISELRNWGASFAQGEVLAFLDADCVPAASWITTCVSRLQATNDAVVGAHYRIPQPSSWIAKAWYGGSESEKVGAVSYIPAGDLIVSRAAFQAVGGFDESIHTNEDAEFCHRARARGLSVMAFPDLAVEHLGTPQTLVSFYGKQRWHGTHVFKVFLRERGSQNAKPVALAISTLIALLVMMAGLISVAVTRNYYLLAGSFCALLTVPAARGLSLALRRKRIADALPLALLTLVYAVARSTCLLDIRNWALPKKISRPKKESPAKAGID